MQKELKVTCVSNCDMYPTYGFVGGFREADAKVAVYSESWNNIYSILYHVVRKENQESFENADLIAIGIGGDANSEILTPLYKILYKKLWKFNKKVVIMIWPHCQANDKFTKFHYKQCEFYGFNIIDVRKYCQEKDIFKFYTSYHDYGHFFFSFGSGISRRIIKEYDKLHYPKKLKNIVDEANFVIAPVKEFVDETSVKNVRTFTRYEDVCELKYNEKLKIPAKYKGLSLIGIHTFSGVVGLKAQAKFIIENESDKFLIHTGHFNHVTSIRTDKFIIDENTYINNSFDDNLPKLQPIYGGCVNSSLGLINLFLLKENELLKDDPSNYDESFELSKEYDFSYILDFLIEGKNFIEDYNKRQDPIKLAPLQKQISEKDNLINSLNQEKQKLEQDKNQQIQTLTNEKNSLQNEKSSLQTQISKLQNSLNSIPTKKTNLEVLNLEQDLKIKELQVLKIQKELEQELKNKKLEELKLKKELGEKFIQNITLNLINANSAKARIQNHLAYKLGTALIINSKSIFGYIKMPYILMAITIAHKEQNKNLKLAKDKLPPLESYADYQEALKEKECFTYKLGEALMKAHKNWYKGGYLKFYFKDVRRLKGEFGKSKQILKNKI